MLAGASKVRPEPATRSFTVRPERVPGGLFEGEEWGRRGCGVCGGSGPVGSLGDRDPAYDGGPGAMLALDLERASDGVQSVSHAL